MREAKKDALSEGIYPFSEKRLILVKQTPFGEKQLANKDKSHLVCQDGQRKKGHPLGAGPKGPPSDETRGLAGCPDGGHRSGQGRAGDGPRVGWIWKGDHQEEAGGKLRVRHEKPVSLAFRYGGPVPLEVPLGRQTTDPKNCGPRLL